MSRFVQLQDLSRLATLTTHAHEGLHVFGERQRPGIGGGALTVHASEGAAVAANTREDDAG